MIHSTNIDGIETDVKFSTRLLGNAEVAVVPGTPFGVPVHVKLLKELKLAIRILYLKNHKSSYFACITVNLCELAANVLKCLEYFDTFIMYYVLCIMGTRMNIMYCLMAFQLKSALYSIYIEQ